ncbi:ATP-binding protein [Saccharothrix australiensis]|uniref:AAA+ ATPase domain-containing protein n=1 Tax=Saccharothrix australiensis TaxID=2072 RepID=A0A495W199_9PSEU|nr:ATP-binding protein [Saccharothrix australiensis]RKT55396.1 hypothetical protein C8E97_4064 [Saccharothrix australiensis]
MTAPTTGPRVRCPVCLDQFDWREDELWATTDEVGRYELVDLSAVNDPVKRRDMRRGCYQRCPNPSDDTEPHHLPASYLDYGPPLVVGLVGRSGSGKTHLLTSVIAELERGGLQGCGVSARAMDLQLHQRFETEQLRRLERAEELPGTRHGLSGFASVMTLTSAAGTRPVTFFDISGEDFLEGGEDLGRTARFVIGVDALLFVETPEHALGIRNHEPESTEGANKPFQNVLSRLSDLGMVDRTPAALVLNKSDRLRYLPPVDRWIRRDDDGVLDADAMLEESRDVYGFLHQHGAHSSLSPFHEFPLCTLHFASATGAEPVDRKFVRGVRPMRVLRPLIALLAMTGVLAGPEARKVGRWHVQTR